MEYVRFNGPEDDETNVSHESDDDDDEKDKPTKRALSKSLFGIDSEKPKKSIFETKSEEPVSDVEKILKSSPEVTNELEQSTNPEVVEHDEEILAAKQFVEVSVEDAAQELQSSEIGTAEEAEAAVSLAFNRALEEGLDEAESTEQAVEQAEQAALEALDLDNDEIEPTTDPEVEPNNEDEDDGASNTVNATTPPTIPSPTTPSPSTPNQPPNPPTSPPIPPLPPQPPVGNPQNPGGNLPPPPPINPNFVPTPNTTPNLNPVEINFEQRRRRAGDLLLGGIVGYMIGRRRGRIKTENRLLPVQHKLEKQVGELQRNIIDKEATLRKLARSKFESEQSSKTSNRQEKINELRSKVIENGASTDRGLETTPTTEQFTRPNLESPSYTKIGLEKVLSIQNKEVDTSSVDTIELPLLLEIAANIKLGDVSLRTMYEKGTIQQQQLRRVIKEYMRGEKLEKIWPKALEHNSPEGNINPELGPQIKDSESNSSEPTTYDKLENAEQFNPVSSQHNNATVNLSPIAQSIIEEAQTPVKHSPAPTIITLVLAIIIAIVIITLFT